MAAAKVIVHIGHYGSGKTELSLNVALGMARGGRRVVLVDLDIVNPFFRSGEQRRMLEESGVAVVAPLFVNKTVEIPALPGEVLSAFTGAYDCAVLDVGGDPAGATALGRYHEHLERADRHVRCVVNACRPETDSAEGIAAMARLMQQRGRVRVDALVNNTNLSGETDAATVLAGARVVRQAAGLLGVPLEFTSARRDLAPEIERAGEPVYPMDLFIRPFWL